MLLAGLMDKAVHRRTGSRVAVCITYSSTGRFRFFTQKMQSTGHESIAVCMAVSVSAHC